MTPVFSNSLNTKTNISLPQRTMAYLQSVFALGCILLSLVPASARAEGPFSREISLLGGVSRGNGSGLEGTTSPAAVFWYARSFKQPKPDSFLVRVIADTIISELKTSSEPIANLAANRETQALLIRFGFSGCYLWGSEWMGCLDDGPRMSYLMQGKTDAQVLGSFPLGISFHAGSLYPWMLMARAELGRWESRKNGVTQNNTLALYLLGVGYNW